jgi:hypothetical protein
MPQYMFRCPTCKEGDQPLTFAVFLSSVPAKVKKDSECAECGGRAPRAFDLEIPTQSVVGLTPISKATTGPGSMYDTVKYAFGANDSKDPNQAPFRDSGELNAFLNGANDLGKPKIDQRTGLPLKRPDGSVIREGAKLIKYDRNATPSRDDVRKKPAARSARWRGGEGKFDIGKNADIRIKD